MINQYNIYVSENGEERRLTGIDIKGNLYDSIEAIDIDSARKIAMDLTGKKWNELRVEKLEAVVA